MVTEVLMAVRPKYAESILAGHKRYELRRSRPHLDVGAIVWLYATKPRGAVIGRFEVDHVIDGTPSQLWQTLGPLLGVSRAELRRYLAGRRTGYAIKVKNVSRLDRDVELPPSAAVPQSYRFLRHRRASDRVLSSTLAAS